MNRQRSKIIAAGLILAGALGFLVIVGLKNTGMRHFTPDELVAHAAEVDKKGIQVDGLIAEGTTRWDGKNVRLTFAVRDREGKAQVNVLYANKLRPDNFKDGGDVFVQGTFDAEKNLIVASKLQTKCASKYEAAEGAAPQTSQVNTGDY